MTIKRYVLCIPLIILLFTGAANHQPLDEGMFPLSELKNLDLAKAGFKITQKEIYNPDSVSLVDALVRVGGCTGSFISNEGLIITNHHCAFDAVKQASSVQKDYLTNGFVARSREEEIEAKGLSCRITDSYEDVSAEVLNAVADVTDPALRIKLINEKKAWIAEQAETADSTIDAEVSEMFIGKSYVLFRYKTIQDVRLVYVPARNIGEFGGETDNWMWPRHTGDFAFMRAYVAPDGSPAAYSKENVPYKPAKFLKVNASGVDENDFVFILGYPGQTFRNRPAQYIQYQQDYLLPYISDLYDFQNKVMEEVGQKSKETQLKLASRIKRNANVLKNYRGKLKGLKAIQLTERKQEDDARLAEYIQSDKDLKERYGNLMSGVDKVYQSISNEAYRDLWLGQIYSSTNLVGIAGQINSFRNAMNAKTGSERTAFYKRNIQKLESRLNILYDSFDEDVDRRIFIKMLEDASKLPKNQRINAVDKQSLKAFNAQEQLRRFAESTLLYTRLKDRNFVLKNLIGSPNALNNYNDQLLNFEAEINRQIGQLNSDKAIREGELNRLLADYLSVKERYSQKMFIPDANSTLRLTYGFVKGYSPADATYMKPFTSVKGILEKGSTGTPDYSYPKVIKELWDARDFGQFVKNDLNDVPVAFLYDLDTTGGNSGSPVLNDEGELVGVNFDRAYEATINDFAWNEAYSRSIGVDIRYVLWIASKVDKADFLLKEIGI